MTGSVEFERGERSRRFDVVLASDDDTFDGTLLTGEDGTLVNARYSLDALGPYASLAGIDVRELDHLAVEGAVTASESAGLWTVEIEETRAGDALVAGRVAGSGRRWQGEIETGALPLDVMVSMPLGAAAGRSATEDGQDRDGFGAPAFPRIDLLLSLSARTATLWDDLVAEQASMQLALGAGRVAIEDFTARIASGVLSGEVSVTNADGTGIVAGRFDLDDVNIRDVPLPGSLPLAAGTVSLDGTIDASGRTIDALLTSATGGGEIVVDDPRIDVLEPLALGRIYDRIDDGLDIEQERVTEIVEDELFDGPFAPRRTRADWNASSGTVRLDIAPVADAGTTLEGDIEWRPLRDELDGTLTVTLGVPDDRAAGGDPSVRIRVGGDPDGPMRELDVGPLTGFLNLRAFEIERDRVAALRASLVETQRLRRETLLHARIAREAAAARAEVEARADDRAGRAPTIGSDEPDKPAPPPPAPPQPAPPSTPGSSTSSSEPLPRLNFDGLFD